MRGFLNDSFIASAKAKLLYCTLFSIVYFIIAAGSGYTVPLVIAMLAAVILRPAVSWFSLKLRISRALAAAAVTFLVFTGFGAVLVMLSMRLVAESGRLLQELDTIKSSEFMHSLLQTVLPFLNNEAQISGLLQQGSGFAAGLLKMLLSFLSAIPIWFTAAVLVVFATYFFLRIPPFVRRFAESALTPTLSQFVCRTAVSASRYLNRTVRIYFQLISLTFAETYILLLILRIPYALTLSLAAALCDLIPFIGTGLVLFPIAVVLIVQGHFVSGIIIIAGWVIMITVRQLLEMRWLASSVHIHPLWMLLAAYAGLRMGNFFVSLYIIGIAIILNISHTRE
jgi:predicted PurR-regulated permease PerM